MKRLTYGSAAWRRHLASLPRAGTPPAGVDSAVAAILRAVERGGDGALVRLTRRFDGVALTRRRLRVTGREIQRLARGADPGLVSALQAMGRQIEVFHRRQLDRGFRTRVAGGAVLEERVSPLQSVGLYVPGGAGAYPSSVLMNAIPARVAGVPRIVVMTPPRTLETNPAVAVALIVAGADSEVYRVGGAQAVAALACGTRSITAVDKIVGPGNAFVAAAKRQVRGRVEIDHEAGPSEVVVLADDTADPGWVAADLLAQAEHGSGDEAVTLVTPSLTLADEVTRLVWLGLSSVANVPQARRALARHGAVVLVRDLDEGVLAVNALAAEHVEVQAKGGAALARRIVAGAVFVGAHAPVAVGDYGIGPNHVLPTGGAARYSSPLSVRDFQRRQSVVTMTERSLRRVAPVVVTVARAEGFIGHAQSVLTRFATDAPRAAERAR